MKHFKEKLEIETLRALTYTQINELLNKLTLENKELKEQLRIGVVSQQRELLICVDKGNWGCLTEQKEYELLADYRDIYMIKDDDDAINNYDAKYFKKVKAN
tara:strand:- start:882 stop:1187 length:306 start_codon:yes stop_codon:yes gene_type:complete